MSAALQVTDPVDAEEVRATVSEVLSRPEFQPRSDEEPPFLRYLEELLSGSPSLGIAGDIAFWLAIACGALVLTWLTMLLLTRLPAGRAPRRVPEGVERTPAERVRELLQAAASARDEGDARLALRLYFFALVVGLGARGDLEYDDAWTNRELVERGEPNTELRAWLEPLVGELDALFFGSSQPSDGDVERLAQLARQHVGGMT